MNERYRSDLPEHYYYGGGGETFATPLALLVLVTAAILIVVLPRRYAVVPLLMAALVVPLRVVIVIGGLHLNASRLLIGVGFARLLFRRGRASLIVFNGLDKAVIYGLLWNAVTYSLLWRTGGAVVNRLGYLWTGIGSYVLLRCLVRNQSDVFRAIRVLCTITIVVAPFMLYEHFTGANKLAILGSPAVSLVRLGQVRAQGPFGHAIIAGTVGATLVPLFVGLWWSGGRSRLLASAGITAASVMVFTAASSTPLMSYAAAGVALLLWPLRRHMRIIRWGVVLMLCGLQLFMKVPVWFVLERVSAITGGSGYHRATLIDNFIWHAPEWFAIGTTTNADWGWSMWDVDNAYVASGITGGLIGLVLFLRVFVSGYTLLGLAAKAAGRRIVDSRRIWCIGAALFAHTIGFLGIVYFDQSVMWWYALLAFVQVTPNWIANESPTLPKGASTAAGDEWPCVRPDGDFAPVSKVAAGALLVNASRI